MTGRRFKKGDEATRRAASEGGKVTALQRRASREPYSGSIIDLMDEAGMVGQDWTPWRAFWKGCFGLPMTDEELAIFQRHTGRETPPTSRVSEAWMVVGRRGGKSTNAALGAFYQGITADRRAFAKPGEMVTIPLLASDRKQSRILLGHLRGLTTLPAFRPYVHRGTLKETIELTTGVDVEIMTASWRGTRGYTSPAVVCDEIAHWMDEGSNPADEILDALRPTMGTVPGALLLALSNPHAPRGPLYQAVETYYGKDDPETLVWIADTRSMHPSYSQRVIARAFNADPVVAASEYGTDGKVIFRQHQQALFDADPVNNTVVVGRRELPPQPGTKYVAFLDAAQGSRSGDSMTLGIAHRDGALSVLDVVREVQPPFSPGDVLVNTFAPILQQYDVREVTGDHHAVGFVAEGFATCGIRFVPSVHTKSDLYAELLALVNTGMVELLDVPTLRAQLLALQRRSARGGKDSIDHPRGGHDDVANVAAGALVTVTGIGVKKKPRAKYSFGDSPKAEREQDQNAVMLELIARTKRRLEAEAELDWERAQRARNQPMVGQAVWHVHGK